MNLFPASYYEQQIQIYSKKLIKLKRSLFNIAIGRLLIFLFAGILTTILVLKFGSYYLLTVLPFIVIFLYLLKRNESLRYQKKYASNIVIICENELKSLSGNNDSFDGGKEFYDEQHPYSSDLDIFGEKSLFQLLNRTVSYIGKIKLADLLKNRLENEKIIENQELVAELSQAPDFRMDFLAKGMMLENDKNEVIEILNWVKQPTQFLGFKYLKFFIFMFPAITILLLVASFFSLSFNAFVVAFIFQLGFTALFLRKINSLHAVVSRKAELLNHFSSLFQKIEFHPFTSKGLKELKSKFAGRAHSSSYQIEKLSFLIRMFDNRLNMLAALLLNGLFLWDLHISFRLEKWKQNNMNSIKIWIDTLAEFDAFISLSNYAFNHPDFQFPKISQKDLSWKFIDLSHPLINVNERISNSFSLQGAGNIAIITGSNMAGKSTFLRTIGVNVVLASAGVPVCAKEMWFYPIQLYSSMRIRDDLSNRESTFYAELKRISIILEEVEKQSVFILLDEILKGTNSTDKLTGSRALLRQLAQSDSVAVIATHDLALGELEKELPEKICNYNFEVEINKDEFYFDYKLKNGICKILNATELMKKMGVKV